MDSSQDGMVTLRGTGALTPGGGHGGGGYAGMARVAAREAS